MQTHLKTKSFASAVLFLICVVLGFFLVLPKWREFSDSQSLLTQANSEYNKLKEAESRLNNFLEEFEKLSEQAKVANSALPAADKKVPALLSSIEQMAKSSGLSLHSIVVGDKPDQIKILDNAIDTVDLEVSMSGSYPAFRNFLLLLETDLRIVDLQKVSFQVENPNNIKFQIALRSYYQK